jgi:hypothetical protein
MNGMVRFRECLRQGTLRQSCFSIPLEVYELSATLQKAASANMLQATATVARRLTDLIPVYGLMSRIAPDQHALSQISKRTFVVSESNRD